MDVTPYGEQEIFEAFRQPHSYSKHLLTIYSLAVGTNARRIVDLGIGTTTRALRFAAQTTGGVCYSGDVDAGRFSGLLAEQDSHWRLFLGSSDKFIASLNGPVDFFSHDGAHDYFQVRMDLMAIIPRMKRFGLICLHDTQQTDLRLEMLAAVEDIGRTHPVSMVHLPYSAGLTIMRVEESDNETIVPATGLLADGRPETTPTAMLKLLSDGVSQVDDTTGAVQADRSLSSWLRWRARKIVKGY